MNTCGMPTKCTPVASGSYSCSVTSKPEKIEVTLTYEQVQAVNTFIDMQGFAEFVYKGRIIKIINKIVV